MLLVLYQNLWRKLIHNQNCQFICTSLQLNKCRGLIFEKSLAILSLRTGSVARARSNQCVTLRNALFFTVRCYYPLPNSETGEHSGSVTAFRCTFPTVSLEAVTFYQQPEDDPYRNGDDPHIIKVR